ncbi:MAG: response regulator [Cellulosilyticum sp.]|nr:response regulator [Cellulosilyticum sp.]
MSTKINILVVEDEKNIRNFISTTLKNNDYKVIECQTGSEALSISTSHCPDVILLDLGLPDLDGINVLKSLRSWSAVPIIIISARTQETEKVTALDLGADDYITKPFGTSELLARIRTALRHSTKHSPNKVFRVKDLLIDFDKRLVSVQNKEVHLTQIEFKLVSLLAQNAGKVLTYDHIITSIWGPYADKNNQILRVNMANIRRKIEENPGDPKYIFTEVGVGYRMIEDQDSMHMS